MELKATSLGKHLAQHPYDRVQLLNAGVKVWGDKHEYILPFNQLLEINCKRGLVWGELEFVLSDAKVVRLHGTEWGETQRFYYHLSIRWEQWSQEMSLIAADVLNKPLLAITQRQQQGHWLTNSDLAGFQQQIRDALSALPLPLARLPGFDNCRDPWQVCQYWLDQGEVKRQKHNDDYSRRMLQEHAEFFAQVESSPLNSSQAMAVVNGEDNVLVLAGAGSGKTSVLVARAGWLLTSGAAVPQQILLLAFGRKAAEEMQERVSARLKTEEIEARTFHALALEIIRQGGRKEPQISKLESNREARYQLFTETWREQCASKKAQAKGWRQWLTEELEWEVPENEFWLDDDLSRRLAPRLDRWVALMRMHGGTQADMIDKCPEEIQAVFSKYIKLLAPLLKAWKGALKAEDALDFSGLIHQAVHVLDKGRFVSPWKYILVDEFQDISPQRAELLAALRRNNSHTALFVVGDDWQAIYRFSGAELSLTTAFHHYFGDGDCCSLDTTYRFNGRIGEIANAFIQQNPYQLNKSLNSLMNGDKKAVQLLPEAQLESLLDKMSGYVKEQQTILILARYHHLAPDVLKRASTRWPKLNIDFMTIHASKGQQADYVIVLGLSDGQDGFPALARESVVEQALLPEPEDFPDAEERRLLYVALTRARHRVWLLYSPQQPSVFVDVLRQLGVPQVRKP